MNAEEKQNESVRRKIWLATYLASFNRYGVTPANAHHADLAVKEFEARFLVTKPTDQSPKP